LKKNRKTIECFIDICLIDFSILFLSIFCSTAFAEEGIEWGRFRFTPEISTSEKYTDNVYLIHTDGREDTITTVSPKVSLDFAFAPRNYITFSYGGDFRFYRKSDNFKKDIHKTGLFWTLTTPKGSNFKIGASADFDSIQPWSEKDHHRDFVVVKALVDTLFKVSSLIELGIKYDYESRRFEDSIDEIDDFDMNTITFDIGYQMSPITEFLLEYSYCHQNNNNKLDFFTDMDTNTIFVGVRWDPTAKLSGDLKMGYTQTSVKEGDDFSGFAIDADLDYKLSDITRFKATASRMLMRSTVAARETGIYYISTGGDLSATYSKWEPLKISMNLTYTNNNFEQLAGVYEDREDNVYTVGLKVNYLIKNWLTSTLSYQYRRNKSNVESEDYKENRAELLFSLSI
jgi:hypothetical protein